MFPIKLNVPNLYVSKHLLLCKKCEIVFIDYDQFDIIVCTPVLSVDCYYDVSIVVWHVLPYIEIERYENANIELLKNALIYVRFIAREPWKVTEIVGLESFEGKFISLEEFGKKICSLTNVIKLVLFQIGRIGPSK